jgi:hypothetical protein
MTPAVARDKLPAAERCLLRSVHISRGMLIFMQHTGVVKRLFVEVRPQAAAGDSHQ